MPAAEIWKTSINDMVNHKIWWFEGKKWREKRPVFALFFYSFDMYLYPEVKINYNPDGTVSEEGKKDMPSIRMDFRLWKESCHGEKKIYFYQQHHIVYYPD